MFCVAYKNAYTTEVHNEQNNPAGGWVRVSAYCQYYDEARRVFDAKVAEFSESTAVALFVVTPDRPWFDGKMRLLHNRHVIFSESAIRHAFGGLINAVESDWF